MNTPAVTITFIRHGESTDNLLPIWAGWRDAPLSEHGQKQAQALAKSLSCTHFDAIHASTLTRALSTAQAVHSAQPSHKPPLYASPVLREQTRGVAEGHPWLTECKEGLSLEEHYAQGLYPIHHERWQKFPGGESLDDLAARAESAVEEVILPYIHQVSRDGGKVHIAVASHGLLIAEMIPVLMKMDTAGNEVRLSYKGMLNTAWTRVHIDVWSTEAQNTDFSEKHRSKLGVQVTHFNSHAHLQELVPDKGLNLNTVGSNAVDSVQTFAGDDREEKCMSLK